MANAQYLDKAGLTHYDEKIKAHITTKADDAKNAAISTSETYTDTKTGTLTDLSTENKATLVAAINEVRASVEAGGTGSVVTISTDTTSTGASKSYTFKQGTTTLGTVDIPKDMVVSSGTVETNPQGQTAGTYLVLTLANATNDKIYINVGTLVDIYTAQASASKVQLTINSTSREISATLVSGSVTATELASDAVTTVKIADKNVTKAKLATDVQTSLGKADTALQESDIATLKTDVSDVKTSIGTGGATTLAIADAKKAGTDASDAVSALKNGDVKTNANNITSLEDRVDALEADTFVAITDTEIDTLFA